MQRRSTVPRLKRRASTRLLATFALALVARAQEASAQNARFLPPIAVGEAARQPLAGQRSPGRAARTTNEQLPYAVQLTPPGPLRLFGQLESEDALREKLRTEALSAVRPRQIEFPADYPQEAPHVFERGWDGLPMFVPPHYVCHKRLYFEQPWSERCGNHVGLLQPGLSAGIFYSDVLLFPLKWLNRPWRIYDCHRDGCSPFFLQD